MIATRRGLSILFAITVLFAVIVIGDLRRPRVFVDRSIARGLDVDRVTALSWSAPGPGLNPGPSIPGPGAPTVELVRGGDHWRWRAPFSAPADPGTVGNLLATLRAARWHRSAPAASAGPIQTTLTISTAMPTTPDDPPEYADLPRRTIGIGRTLDGAEQTWIVDGANGYLVDAWVARSLAPDPLTLMIRRPFETVAQAPWIEVADSQHSVRLEGNPRRRVQDQTLVRAELVADLHRSLAALEIVALAPAIKGSAAEPATAVSMTITVPGLRTTLGGSCGGNAEVVLLASSSGTGCVRREAAAMVRASFAALLATQIVEDRPAPIDAESITLRDGTILDVAKVRIGDAPADPARVVELLAVLAAPGTIAPMIPTVKTQGTIKVTDRSGVTIIVEILVGSVVHRPTEAVAIDVTPAGSKILARTANDFRDRTLWTEDPLAISAITIDATKYSRGAVIGEWTRTGTAVTPTVARALETLASALAQPRALAAAATTVTTSRHIVLDITPPSGVPSQHTLELGARIHERCPVRAAAFSHDGTLWLAGAVCDALAAVPR